MSDIINTAVAVAAQPGKGSSGTLNPIAQQGEMNNPSLLPLVQIYCMGKIQRKGDKGRTASAGHSTRIATSLCFGHSHHFYI